MVDHHIVGGGCYESSNDIGAQSASLDFGTELVFPDLRTKSEVTHKQYLFQCVGRGEGIWGGGGCYKLISDLGVESAMSDFKPESFFLTLFKGQTFLTSELIFFPS